MKHITEELKSCILAIIFTSIFLIFAINLLNVYKIQELSTLIQKFQISIGGY